MSYSRAFSPDLIAALLDADGEDKWTICVEAEFGSRIADDGSGGADTSIVLNGTDILLLASIDGGQTWRTVPPAYTGFSSAKIPGLEVGQSVTNTQVILRALFHRPTSRLISVSTTANLENGDSFLGAATWATLDGSGSGPTTITAHGVKVAGTSVRPAGEAGAGFAGGDDQLIFRRSPAASLGPKVETNVSRGTTAGLRAPSGDSADSYYFEAQDPFETDPSNPRFAAAACAWEAWIYAEDEPSQEEHLCSWWTIRGRFEGVDGVQHGPSAGLFLTSQGTLRFGPPVPSEVNVPVGPAESPPMTWAGRWRHVCFSYDGLGMKLYVDGTVVAVASLRIEPVTHHSPQTIYGYVLETDGDFRIGNDGRGRAATSFVITESRLWGRSINPQRLMRRRLSVAEAAMLHANDNLHACWPLIDNGNDIAPDGLHLAPENSGFASKAQSFSGLIPPRTRVTPGDPPRRVGYWDINMMDISVDSNLIRLCSGASKVTFPDGREFTAAGNLLNIGGSVRERSQVDPDQGLSFELTGLDPQLRSIAMNAAYLNRPIRLYLATQNEGGGFVGDPVLLWEGRMDQMVPTIRTEGEGDKQTPVLTIGLKAETLFGDFARPSAYRWNKDGHRAVFPDDAGMDEVAVVAERQELWPRQANLDDSEAPE